ncbi:MAG: outer membrane lipoprotein-sorting protein [Acidobacteriota bacterium]|nr:outer membrane lipoprotein-sorting protein [Acidobacteriota bacterium]
MKVSRFLLLGLIAAVLACCPGCLFRTRKVQVRVNNEQMLKASLDDLVNRINTEAAKVRTLDATVNIDTSVGGQKKGEVTDYQQISGYVLIRRPSMIRMIGLFPLVRNKAFDMVSDGAQFKLWIPVKNKFYVGHNDVVKPAANPIENLRPQVIYEALLLHAIDPAKDIAVLEADNPVEFDEKTKQVRQLSTYVVDVIRKDNNGKYYLQRKVIFDRQDLIPDHQIFYDKHGSIVTDANYSAFKYFNDARVPTIIEIKRPQEDYDITIAITKATVNGPVKDEQFALEQPPGSQLVDLDEQPVNAGVSSTPPTPTSHR